jgi:hypothetical protein
MKRVLALALVGGALLLGGCDRQPAAAPPTGAPAVSESHATPAAAATKSDESDSDVDSLLSDVDKQLSSDDQSPADQD